MHISVMEFLQRETEDSMFKDKKVLEGGSLDVNGSVKPFVASFSPQDYIGIDITDGPGVDVVLPAEELVKTYGEDAFDTVISAEMLEHAKNWRECINNMKLVTKDYLIITTRGPGFPHHEYPHDCWRYTVSDFEAIFSDFKTIALLQDWMEPGVFYIGRKEGKRLTDLSNIHLQPAP